MSSLSLFTMRHKINVLFELLMCLGLKIWNKMLYWIKSLSFNHNVGTFVRIGTLRWFYVTKDFFSKRTRSPILHFLETTPVWRLERHYSQITICPLDFGTVPTMRYFLFCYFHFNITWEYIMKTNIFKWIFDDIGTVHILLANMKSSDFPLKTHFHSFDIATKCDVLPTILMKLFLL